MLWGRYRTEGEVVADDELSYIDIVQKIEGEDIVIAHLIVTPLGQETIDKARQAINRALSAKAARVEEAGHAHTVPVVPEGGTGSLEVSLLPPETDYPDADKRPRKADITRRFRPDQ